MTSEPGDASRTPPPLHADDVRSSSATRYGAYLCLNVPPAVGTAAAHAVADLVRGLDLKNEFDAMQPSSASTVAFLRRTKLTKGDIIDDHVAGATSLIHVSSETAAPTVEFQSVLADVLGVAHRPASLAGVVRPPRYTGNAMHNYAYAHRVLQQSGVMMPCAFLIPLTKTAAWWKKDWMERHTFFLPRYDQSGRMTSQGHALAAAAGISRIMRRTYWNAVEPAPAGEYDFVNYFECCRNSVSPIARVRSSKVERRGTSMNRCGAVTAFAAVSCSLSTTHRIRWSWRRRRDWSRHFLMSSTCGYATELTSR